MTNRPDILERIVSRKREEIAERRRSVSRAALEKRVAELSPPRGFAEALVSRTSVGSTAVVAEIKRASPSKGLLRPDFHPAQIARSYAAAGATCLSVLTDVDFFQGADSHLIEARDACSLPVLRKDFVIDPYQVLEARAIGADCILLIVACLDDHKLSELTNLADDLGMDVLVETHDAGELARAVKTAARLVGINNRDLRTFKVDLQTTIDLSPLVSEHRLVITESGIRSREDVARLRRQGVSAFLVGEAFMREADPGKALARIFDQTPVREPSD